MTKTVKKSRKEGGTKLESSSFEDVTAAGAPAIPDFIFDVDSSSKVDVEDDSHVLAPVLKYAILGAICVLAFSIRLFAVVRYESVIHEFDPYFNYRTTKYLTKEGFLAFLDWFDDRAWYPLGRIIGGTIYPGLMYTAAMFYWVLNKMAITINVRNMCVFLAPLFAGNTAIASYLLTKEVTRRTTAGLLAAAFTAIVPSYISRSVGGSYDNEGVAIFALVFTFYLWIKAVHTGSMFWGAATALSYFYMVAAWGGYVFIINMIPIHVLILILGGRYTPRLYIAYSTFYALGSLLAMQVPFVGFNVVKQAECAGSHGVFALLQVYVFVGWMRSFFTEKNFTRLVTTVALVFVVLVGVTLVLLQLLGKVQWTGRSLTLLDPTYASKYIPIIASVSEHQPTTWTSFFFDLHVLVPFSPVGLYLLYQNITDGAIFVILYGTLAWYFAGVMVRLMLTLAPIACILGAIGVSTLIRKYMIYLKAGDGLLSGFQSLSDVWPNSDDSSKTSGEKDESEKKLRSGSQSTKQSREGPSIPRGLAAIVILGCTFLLCKYSYHASYVSSMAYSHPSIVVEGGRRADGSRVLLDDFREAYYWLRHNTDPDAKIMSWWDYGYQMSSMANRTVIVDNNTWNNTHIATVGRALASTEEKAYPILKSLDVDYMLVIFGGMTGYSSDDINKFLWPVRIGSGVYPNDMPKERDFYSSGGAFDVGPGGSETLLNCVAYKLCYYRFGEVATQYGKPTGFDRARNTEIGNKDFELETMEEAFTSQHWIVRIYKVKDEPNFLESSVAKKKKRSKGTKTTKEHASKFLGCVLNEDSFGKDRMYSGGQSGSSHHAAAAFSAQKGSRFFAISRVGGEGHVFAFDKRVADFDGGEGRGCKRPCLDDPAKYCGCADVACDENGDTLVQGQEHNRRWAVYERIENDE